MRYQGNLGGKTGFTDAARHTFVTAAERNGRRVVVSVMDTEAAPLRAADQAALLLDWGVRVPAGIDGVGTAGRAGDLTPATVDGDRGGPARHRGDAGDRRRPAGRGDDFAAGARRAGGRRRR